MLKVILITAASLFLLTACAAGRTSDCPYRSLVGQSLTSEKIEGLRQSGKEIRPLYTDSFLGFEKHENRINLIHDENDRVVAVTCG